MLCNDISIHAPHTGRDDSGPRNQFLFHVFQSTRPIRGATYMSLFLLLMLGISIHAPHTGRDVKYMYTIVGVQIFQSTRPIRGATKLA